MNNSESIGRCVGLLTRRVEGKQFHMQRVGRLSRECGFIENMIAFRNYVIEKLALQESLYPNVTHAINDSSKMIKECDHYDREAFLSGFWQTYNRPINAQWSLIEWDASGYKAAEA